MVLLQGIDPGDPLFESHRGVSGLDTPPVLWLRGARRGESPWPLYRACWDRVDSGGRQRLGGWMATTGPFSFRRSSSRWELASSTLHALRPRRAVGEPEDSVGHPPPERLVVDELLE